MLFPMWLRAGPDSKDMALRRGVLAALCGNVVNSLAAEGLVSKLSVCGS